ncbi:MAG TPA: DUF481 domain-containing protein [Opitutales bacterium]|nr:DUF481 domain-containing protein [Opitutales bacterium]
MLLAAGFGAMAPARAEVLVFDNGDKLTGTVLAQNSQTIRFQSATLGVINVPAGRAHVEAPPATPAAAAPVHTQEKPPPAPEPTLVDRLKDTLGYVLPGEISGHLDAGLTNTRTNAATTQIIAVGNITALKAPNTYDFKAFYYYTASRAADGSVSRSADRYGANASYQHDLTERLFLSNEGSYLRDFNANIDHQAQDSQNVGYDLWKSKRADLAVQAGPTQRYVEAVSIPVKWRTLGGGKQTFRWRFTDSLRLEEDVHALVQLDEFENQAWALNAALINKLTRGLELSLRFSQSYNTIVGLNGARSEQILALTLGMTF